MVPCAVALGSRSLRMIRQNLPIALNVIASLVPSDLFGLISLPWGVVRHEESTLPGTPPNGLRLLRPIGRRLTPIKPPPGCQRKDASHRSNCAIESAGRGEESKPSAKAYGPDPRTACSGTSASAAPQPLGPSPEWSLGSG